MQPKSINSQISIHSHLLRYLNKHGLSQRTVTQRRQWNHTSSPTNSDAGLPSTSASAKLFADAAKEEVEENVNATKSSRLSRVEQQHPNWDGDETIHDAVLRMLVDKYKPLRTGTIQSAEEKIKQNPPKIAPAFGALYVSNSNSADSAPRVKLVPTSGSWATEVLLPGKDGHQPWDTQFKAASTEISSVKLARLPPHIVKGKAPAEPLDDRARRMAREEKKRAQQVNKLTQARESTLDYRLGIKGRQVPVNMPNPTTMKGWRSLIEDRIETARKAGMFDTIKGRGKPLERSADEHNPFVAREEFLMNRIVQRNNAAPPWVELQRELETSVISFREILRQAWIRRTIRVLVLEHPPEILRHLTLNNIKNHRDSEWLAKEKSYHDTAIQKLNSLVRNYNGIAPYAVRRPFYTREAEIEKLYDECAPIILRTLAEREVESPAIEGADSARSVSAPVGGGLLGELFSVGRNVAFFEWLRLLFRRLFGIGT